MPGDESVATPAFGRHSAQIAPLAARQSAELVPHLATVEADVLGQVANGLEVIDDPAHLIAVAAHRPLGGGALPLQCDERYVGLAGDFENTSRASSITRRFSRLNDSTSNPHLGGSLPDVGQEAMERGTVLEGLASQSRRLVDQIPEAGECLDPELGEESTEVVELAINAAATLVSGSVDRN